jgi:transposase
VGLALLVSADGDVPLFHHCYAGNKHDSTIFGTLIEQLGSHCRTLAGGLKDLTLVFDKGNNSKENLTEVKDTELHFVGSLVPTQHSVLLAIPRKQMRRLDKAQLPAVWAYRTQQKVFGVQRTVLVAFNRPLYRAQVKTLRRQINKRCRKFKALNEQNKLLAALDLKTSRVA